jgi:predicted enzyme related to lactoylglutathione lyase
MAKRRTAKSSRKKAVKKAPKNATKKATKKSTKRTVKKAVRKRTSTPRPPKVRPGTITHTEIASADPSTTKQWCATVLGWKFGQSMPTPSGPYHMWRFDNGTGGGIRANNPPEVPGSIPYCEVADIKATYAKALAAGAREMMAPEQLPGEMGWIAIVGAPGGVAIGFWSMK